MRAKPITEFRGPHRFLSNFWPVSVEYHGITYPSAEHAYQASKALHSRDAAKIALAATAGAAKLLGRVVELRPGWDAEKVRIMYEILYAKFTQNKELRDRLVNTGNRPLVEGNTWGDTFWGMCDGQGQNQLGRLLMSLRDELGAR